MIPLRSGLVLGRAIVAVALAAASLSSCASVALAEGARDGSGKIADLSGRFAVNSDNGAVLGLGATVHRLFGRDQQLRFNATISEDRTHYSFRYKANRLAGQNPTSMGLSAFASQSHANDTYGFDSAAAQIRPTLTWRLGAGQTASTYLSFSRAEISGVSATTSQLIRNDAGSRERQAVGAQFNWRSIPSDGSQPALRFGLSAEYGSDSRGHRYVSTTARSSATWSPRSDGSVLMRAQVRAGTLNSQAGTSHIGDRFMLGQNSLRGFAYGGFGPRDTAVANAPALGGNSYAVARFDVQFANAFGQNARVKPGLFADIGSLWGLDDAAGGIAGGSPVDDSLRLRSSIGVSLQVDIGVGQLQISAARPIRSESYDKLETIQFSLNRSF